MIKPTVGRVVWFYGHGHDHEGGEQPRAALVTHVWGDEMVNLAVFSSSGEHFNRTSVRLFQGEGERLRGDEFCEWMPYQIGQAKKHEVEAEQSVTTEESEAEQDTSAKARKGKK